MRVGGKGANLGEMTCAGFPVPTGFCVTTEAYHTFVAPCQAAIYRRLEDLNPANLKDVRRVGKSIRKLMYAHPLPENVAKELLIMWEETGVDFSYAVRSSATAEDLPTASFAGQQDTYLNVIGREAMLTRVKQCFISLYTDRAIIYRIKNQFPHEQVALSVVVQRMVKPQVSGILFTADPISENRNILSIDASFGLGEALVSGLVTADLYKVDKHTNVIKVREIATKKIAILPLDNGGTETIQLPSSQQTAQVLSDTQAQELAQVGMRIEMHYGCPQDIEWAIEDGQIYITQSRPITSLFPLPPKLTDDDSLGVFLSFSHIQVMTDAMTPLSISIWRMALPFGLNENGESHYTRGVGGRLYFDISQLLRHPIGWRILTGALGNADPLSQATLIKLAARPTFRNKGKTYNPLKLLPILFPYIRRGIAQLIWARTTGAVTEANAILANYVNTMKTRTSNPSLHLNERLESAIEALQGFLPFAGEWLPKYAAGVVSQRMLRKLVGPVGASLVNDIERGMVGNVVTDMTLAMGDLADLARASTGLAKHLADTSQDSVQRLEAVTQFEGGQVFWEAWQMFLNKYGSRAPSEIDLQRLRWNEDPTSLLQMLVNMISQSETGLHQDHFDKLRQSSLQAAVQLPDIVKGGLFGWIKRPVVRRLVKPALDLTPLREHHKFLAMQIMAELKVIILEIGDELYQTKTLRQSEDIWFLTIPEIRQMLAGIPTELQNKIITRQEQFKQDETRHPPHVMTTEGEIPRPSLSIEGAPKNALIGNPISAGIIEGVARVVHDPSVEILEPGEILVAAFTDPGWTPLFLNASALVTEVGGLMTHGSVVAREYGLPAVAGVLDATTRIKTGDRIRVNGDIGYVEIIGESLS